jgi:GGDEF domain-containing protein
MRIAASIGIAMHPDHGSEMTSLLRHADIAMYEAKRRRSGAERYASVYDRHSRARPCRPARTSIAPSTTASWSCTISPSATPGQGRR